MNKAEEYIRKYPKLEKWINTCSSCGYRGYKPDLPKSIYPWFNVAADNIRELFKPLALNENQVCEQCANYKKVGYY